MPRTLMIPLAALALAFAAAGAHASPIALTWQNTNSQWNVRKLNQPGQHNAFTHAIGTSWGYALDSNDFVVFQTNGTSNYGPNTQMQGMVTFLEIIGAGVNQIPANATITSATLTLRLTGTASGQLDLYQLKQGWLSGPDANNQYSRSSTADSWADWGTLDATNGVTPSLGIDAFPTPVDSETFASKNTVVFDVTSSVQSWANGTASNFGWSIHSGPRSDGLVVYGGGKTDTTGPKLTVEYVIPEPASLALAAGGALCLLPRRRR